MAASFSSLNHTFDGRLSLHSVLLRMKLGDCNLPLLFVNPNMWTWSYYHINEILGKLDSTLIETLNRINSLLSTCRANSMSVRVCVFVRERER